MRPLLSRGTVDRRTALRADEDALDRLWESASARVLLLDAEGRTPVAGGGLRLTVPQDQVRPAGAFYLGHDPEGEYFALPVETAPAGVRTAGLRDVGAALDDRDAGLLTHAVALAAWHATHTHCPRCGAQTRPLQGGHVRECPVDGSHHFPRTDPAVIMLVTTPDGGRALLGRQPSWPAGRYSCLAGFVEPGESAEQAVAREVEEESGIRVRDVTAVVSQPWPFPASLMLGFRAVADDEQPIDVSSQELEDAAWFDRTDVVAGRVLLPPEISIARALVDGWVAEGP